MATLKRHVLVLFVLYIFWSFVGGVIFVLLEENCLPKNDFKGDFTSKNDTFRIALKTVLLHIEDDKLRLDLLQNLSYYMEYKDVQYEKYLSEQNSKNSSVQCSKWTLGNIVKWASFSSSALFTIGYGTPAPTTVIGRIILMIYALIGMPVTIGMLGLAGQIIINKISDGIDYFEKVVYKRTVEDDDEKNQKIFASILLFLLLASCGGIIISSNMQLHHETVTVAIYYWFQTITTIGFGDITIRENQYTGWKLILLAPYAFCVILGLTLMSALLNIVATMITSKIELIVPKRTNDDDDEGALIEQIDEENTSLSMV